MAGLSAPLLPIKSLPRSRSGNLLPVHIVPVGRSSIHRVLQNYTVSDLTMDSKDFFLSISRGFHDHDGCEGGGLSLVEEGEEKLAEMSFWISAHRGQVEDADRQGRRLPRVPAIKTTRFTHFRSRIKTEYRCQWFP